MNIKVYKYIKTFLIFVSAALFLTAFLYWQNNGLSTTNIVYSNPKIPDAFDGFMITQLSDLHNKEFGKDNKRLLNAVAKTEPDIIVITGDLVDSNNPGAATALELVRSADKIAPVYFVSGNHDIWSGIYSELKQQLTGAGTIVLDSNKLALSIGEASINLLGLADPDTISDFMQPDIQTRFEEQLDALMTDSESSFHILLSHRPELFPIYVDKSIHLVFTGHAHGGQIRLPFIGSLFAPDQGYLPQYTSGSYEENGTTMIVSRGLGNSVFPQRLFNRPEIIAVTLRAHSAS